MAIYIHFFDSSDDYADKRKNDYKEPWVSLTEYADKNPVSVIINGSLRVNDFDPETITESDFTGHTYDGEYVFCGLDDETGEFFYTGSTGNIVYGGDIQSIDLDTEYIPDRTLYFNNGTEEELDFIALLITEINYEYDNLINEVNYNKTEEEILLGTPLTFNVTSDGNILWKASNNNFTRNISYRKNDDDLISIPSTTGGTQISVVAGDVVKFYGYVGAYASSTSVYNTFSGSTCGFSVKGNIMSLVDGDNFEGMTELQNNYAFCGLFRGCTGLTDGSKLLLPATTLSNYCYRSMFYDCSSLVKAPELPATELTYCCYSYMFYNCSSLVKAPELPANSITAAYVYDSMFYNCGSLAEAPELPATVLQTGCYSQMFYNCDSLTKAPDLPATRLTNYCYYEMFWDCSNLNYIKCLAVNNLTASNCTKSWITSSVTTGTFVKAAEADWSGKTGYDGIPQGWNAISV